MRTPENIIGKDALMQLTFEGYAVVPTKPTVSMVEAGKMAMPVEYEYRSMQSSGGEEFPSAVRMVVVGWAPTTDQVSPATVWEAMLRASS